MKNLQKINFIIFVFHYFYNSQVLRLHSHCQVNVEVLQFERQASFWALRQRGAEKIQMSAEYFAAQVKHLSIVGEFFHCVNQSGI